MNGLTFKERDTLFEILEVLKRIEDSIGGGKEPKKKKEPNPSSQLAWNCYHARYLERYKVAPTRNAMVNGMISGLCKRVPKEEIEALIQFYLRQSDAFYLQNYHSIKCLLADCEKLLTRMRSGIVITSSKARETEKLSQNINESKEFLSRKYRGENG